MEAKNEDLTLLHHAVYDDSMDTVELMKKNLPYFNEIVDSNDNEEGWTPLLFSVKNANHQMTKLLVESGASTNLSTNSGDTVFHYAAANNDLHMLDYIVKLEQHYSVDI